MEVISSTTPKARHVHTCSLCYGDIEKGDRYARQSLAEQLKAMESET